MAKTETKLTELRINQLSSKDRFLQAIANGEVLDNEFYMTPEEDIDVSEYPITFTKATSRDNVSSGDTISSVFGKIAKWFSDLGSLAFKSTVSKSDLENSVQTSLGKADTALQSYTEQYTGTVKKVNNTSPDANGNVSITIPSEVTESTVSGWGFTKNTGTYSKPSGGIPKTDLASAVQTSLGKADTALQSFTETDPTVPSHVKNITSTDISNWNNKSTFDGNYNSLSNKPTNVSEFTNDANYVKNTDYATTDVAGVIKRGNWITLSSDGKLEAGELTKAQYDSASGKTFVGKTTLENVLTARIPTALSSLSGDATHRVVTDAEKNAWNAKSNFSGSYNDLTDKPESSGGEFDFDEYVENVGYSYSYNSSTRTETITHDGETFATRISATTSNGYTISISCPSQNINQTSTYVKDESGNWSVTTASN